MVPSKAHSMIRMSLCCSSTCALNGESGATRPLMSISGPKKPLQQPRACGPFACASTPRTPRERCVGNETALRSWIAACRSVHGKPIGAMCTTVMAAFGDAKTCKPDVSRALYLPSAAINADDIVKHEASRCALAIHDMLLTAPDAKFEQPLLVSAMLIASIVGPTRAVIEAGGDRGTFEALKMHLTALTVGYLKKVSAASRQSACVSWSKSE